MKCNRVKYLLPNTIIGDSIITYLSLIKIKEVLLHLNILLILSLNITTKQNMII